MDGNSYGKGDTVGTAVETLHVHIRAEETSLSILILVSLHTLKALKGIVEHDGRRVQLKLAIFLDLRLTPTLAGLPLDGQHMVGEGLTKDQFRVGLKLLLLGGFFNREGGSIQGGQLRTVETGKGGGGENLGRVGGGSEGVMGLDGLTHGSLDKHDLNESGRWRKCTGGRDDLEMK